MTTKSKIYIYLNEAWCKSGTRTPGPGTSGPGTQDLPQSLKVGPWTPLKFESGTPGPPSKFKSRIPGSPSKLKVGPPYLSLMNSFFLEYLIVFYLCVFFK